MTWLAAALVVLSVANLTSAVAARISRRRQVALAVSLFASINRVRAVCDEWDGLSKGESPTTARIRQAIGDVP